MSLVEEIKTAVHSAADTNQKIAMFHFQVLKNASVLGGMNAKAFCEEVSVPISYRTEFTKMLGLARLMNELGVKITSNGTVKLTKS